MIKVVRHCEICNKEIHPVKASAWAYKKFKNNKHHWACGYNCFNKLLDKLKLNEHIRR